MNWPDNPWVLIGWIVVGLLALRFVLPLLVLVIGVAVWAAVETVEAVERWWERRTPEGRARQKERDARRDAARALRNLGRALTRKGGV